ncbi:MAG: response regulator transcription factor [Xanthomonadales bacterium]|nr:response regulator transcription factor [Xanthomonadales bacterium]
MHIAFLEDDHDQAEVVKVWIEDAGHDVAWFDRGSDMINAIRSDRFDMVLLDWQVPELDGFSVLRWIRQNVDEQLPVIFLTQRDAEEDVVKALESGADDYLTKPLSPPITLARIEAVARRSGIESGAPDTHNTIGPIEYDTDRESMTLNGELVSLTRREFALAVYLMRNLGRIIPREVLLKEIWGLNAQVVTRTLDTHISRLRKKLQLNEEAGWSLKSIYHHGYRLERLDAES